MATAAHRLAWDAFKAGTGMSFAGNYGAAPNTVEALSNARITPEQVRLQNLKQTRRLAPVARAVIGSFAGAGEGADPTVREQFASYMDKKGPRAATAAGGYNMR